MRTFAEVMAEQARMSGSEGSLRADPPLSDPPGVITCILPEHLAAFEAELVLDEKAPATVEKYLHAVRRFADFLQGGELSKKRLLDFRTLLLEEDGFLPQTVNGFLTAVHAFLAFLGRGDLRLRALKVQRSPFRDDSRELTREEYERLVRTARRRGNARLVLLLETLCATGVRVSELRFFAVEAVKSSEIHIRLKGKNRTILMPKELRRHLLSYACRNGIHSGPVFRTKSGRPLHRSNIAHEMKRLCGETGVEPGKVFPHNLRHLFAREFYAACPNIALLADILGHSRIETTRIYTATSASEHERILESLCLTCCMDFEGLLSAAAGT